MMPRSIWTVLRSIMGWYWEGDLVMTCWDPMVGPRSMRVVMVWDGTPWDSGWVGVGAVDSGTVGLITKTKISWPLLPQTVPVLIGPVAPDGQHRVCHIDIRNLIIVGP